MKRSLIFLTISATALLFGACNQHSWDGEDGQVPSKEVFKDHSSHGHGHGDEHAEGEHAGEKEKGADKAHP